MPFHLVLHHLEKTCWVVVMVVVVVAEGQMGRSMNVADRANDDIDMDIVQIVVVVVVETRGFVHHQERGDPRRRQWCGRCDSYDYDYDSDFDCF